MTRCIVSLHVCVRVYDENYSATTSFCRCRQTGSTVLFPIMVALAQRAGYAGFRPALPSPAASAARIYAARSSITAHFMNGAPDIYRSDLTR